MLIAILCDCPFFIKRGILVVMTTKQDKALAIMAENGGNASQAMLQAGYSPATAKTPGKLTKSKAVKSKIEALAKAHNVTINQYIMNIGLAMTADKQNQFTGEIVPDIPARLAGNKQAERFIFNETPAPPKRVLEGISKDDVDEINLAQILLKDK